MKDFFELRETTIKRDKMTAVDPYYGKTNARGGKSGGPTVFGVDHKKTTVWFKTKKDAKKFVDWKGRKSWNGDDDLFLSMKKDGIVIGQPVSGH